MAKQSKATAKRSAAGKRGSFNKAMNVPKGAGSAPGSGEK